MTPNRVLRRGFILTALSLLLFAIGLAFACCAAARAAGPEAEGAPPVTVEAAGSIEYSVDGKRFVARTGVRIEFEDAVLRADLVEADLERSELVATGGVVITRGGLTVSCTSASYNWDSKALSLVGAATVVDRVHVKGDRIEAARDSLTVTGGSFTRCDLPVPEYRITTARLTIYPGRKLVAENAWLWIAERKLVPVPMLVLPLRAKPSPEGEPYPEGDWGQELPLVPRVGYSEADGVSAGFTYRFYSTERSRAWTDVDLSAKQGLSVAGSYVYAFDPEVEASAQACASTSGPMTFKLWLARTDEAFSLGGGLRRFATGAGEAILGIPEVRLEVNPWRLGPLALGAFLGIGTYLEEETAFRASRGEVGLKLSTPDLAPSGSSTLSASVERRRTWYSTGDGQDVFTGSLQATARATQSLFLSAGYSYTWVDGDSPFEFDDVATANQVSGTVTWRLSPGWSAQGGLAWSLDTNELAGLDFAVIRHLHCFDLTAGWDQLNREFSLRVRMTR